MSRLLSFKVPKTQLLVITKTKGLYIIKKNMQKKQFAQILFFSFSIAMLLWMPLMLIACGKEAMPVSSHTHASLDSNLKETSLEKEVRRVMEKGITLDERKRQVPVIEGAFAMRTTSERARNLAALCYLKTLGTPFSPLDLAEIALVESGGHALSSKAKSSMGALGVWQLMPRQAKSHGYTPQEMHDDEKCAEAAVRALLSKLDIAGGNMELAKKYYCGVGPQADAYLKKLQNMRAVLRAEIDRAYSRMAMNEKPGSQQ